jgi:diguanylate cyclase (GGDEF)-like protein
VKTSRNFVIAGFVLLAAHGLVLSTLGEKHPGPFLSDFSQLSMGGLVVVAAFRASRCENRLGRHFWQLTGVAYCLWMLAQGIGTYGDIFTLPSVLRWTINLVFCFWSVPLAMTLFLDPDYEPRGFDTLLLLDFAQGLIFCVAAYFYFFFIPTKSEPALDLAHSVWQPYFIGYGLVTLAFLLRTAYSPSVVVRQLFGRMGALLLLSGIVDAMYYYGPGSGLSAGAWFDILWSILLLIPLVMAATWKAPEAVDPEPLEPNGKRRTFVIAQVFPLLYPVLVMGMFTGLAKSYNVLAVSFVLVSFMCSTARLLVTHQRLLVAQEALRREASHDGMTTLWNRAAILDILRRELLRAGRSGQSVGIILADVDHFKDVNDMHGHATGDRVLKMIAAQIAAAIRPYDSAGRYGGEEFLIVAPGCTGTEAFELAERIRSEIDNTTAVKPNEIKVTLSLGVVSSAAGSDEQALLHAADQALYEAKRRGRNRVEPSQLASPSPPKNKASTPQER